MVPTFVDPSAAVWTVIIGRSSNPNGSVSNPEEGKHKAHAGLRRVRRGVRARRGRTVGVWGANRLLVLLGSSKHNLPKPTEHLGEIS